MAFLSTSDFTQARPSFWKAAFAATGRWFTAVMDAQSCQDQFEGLKAMSDKQQRWSQ